MFDVRSAVAVLILACPALAQFQSTAPLVLSPVSVTDAKGHYIDGLTASDLILYDNNVPQKTQLDWTAYPIDLVVAVQTSANAGAVIDKLGRSGILFSQLLAGNGGQTAVVSFSDEVTVRQDFTGSADQVTHALQELSNEGGEAHILDGLQQALLMLAGRPAKRRRIVLIVAEKRDRHSDAKLPNVMAMAQKLNATVYWLTFSAFLEPFTARPKTVEDTKPEAERRTKNECALCPPPDDTGVPFDPGPGSGIYAIQELIRLKDPDLSTMFPKVTGGETLSFVRKNALERAIELVGEEVHRQYVLSFEPRGGEAGAYHHLRVAVKDRPKLKVRAREGYWAVQ